MERHGWHPRQVLRRDPLRTIGGRRQHFVILRGSKAGGSTATDRRVTSRSNKRAQTHLCRRDIERGHTARGEALIRLKRHSGETALVQGAAVGSGHRVHHHGRVVRAVLPFGLIGRWHCAYKQRTPGSMRVGA